MPRRAVQKRYASPPPFVPDDVNPATGKPYFYQQYYAPTPSIDPPRPRTLEASYHRSSQTLRVRFREGAVYGYYDVPPNVWRDFRRVKSPGRFINRRLNYFEYGPEEVGAEFGPMPREADAPEPLGEQFDQVHQPVLDRPARGYFAAFEEFGGG